MSLDELSSPCDEYETVLNGVVVAVDTDYDDGNRNIVKVLQIGSDS